MNFSFNNYQQIIFDCDGVILDSNSIKADAFYQVALSYGEAPAKALYDYHKTHGGLSRFYKFDYFFKAILNHQTHKSEIDKLIRLYSHCVYEKLITCPLTEGCESLLKELKARGVECFISSGGAQDELRMVFNERGLSHYFSAIYGSPDNKAIHLKNIELKTKKTLFVGDSRYDFETAHEFGLDFLFLSQYADNPSWASDVKSGLPFFTIKNFKEILPSSK